MRKLYIIGAGQFGREVWGWLSEVKDQSCTFAGFLDDNAQALDGFDVDAKVVAPIAGFKVSKGDCFACAISKPQVKAKLVAPFLAQGADFVNLIHTTAIISRGAILGVGNIFYPFVYIATNARLGNFITLNVASGAGHDCVIGDYSTLSGHCDVTGEAVLGQGVFMGSHAATIPRIRVGDYATIAAGSVAMSHVKPGITVIGVPARIL
jgi:sugar O-acyltransferase (sialic acid O-acetyltransferase NeuD family)